MQVAEISIIGVVAVLVLLAAAVVLFALIDKRLMLRVLRVFGVYTGGILVLGGSCWLVWRADVWWATLLFAVVYWLLGVVWCLSQMEGKWNTLLLPVGLSMLVGSVVAGGSLMLCLPRWAFIPVFGVVVTYLVKAVAQTLLTYRRSLLHTEAHRQYLLANGASVLESLMPSVRRSLRATILPQLRTMASPLVVMMPMLFAGMLLGCSSPVAAAVVSLLLMAAILAASVLAGVVALYCFKR